MTALDRTFIKAFRRRESEPDRQQPPQKARDEAADVAPSIALPPPQEIASLRWQWPLICSRLARDAEEGFQRLAEEIRAPAAGNSPITVAFAGSHSTVGTTSVLLTLARILSSGGKQPLLLIEANFSRPAIYDCLKNSAAGSPESAKYIEGVEIITLPEAGLSLCSLSNIVDETSLDVSRKRLGAFFKDLKAKFPVRVLDAGLVSDSVAGEVLWKSGVVDVAILVDRGTHDPAQRNLAADFLNRHAGQFLGVIETCVGDKKSQDVPRRLTG